MSGTITRTFTGNGIAKLTRQGERMIELRREVQNAANEKARETAQTNLDTYIEQNAKAVALTLTGEFRHEDASPDSAPQQSIRVFVHDYLSARDSIIWGENNVITSITVLQGQRGAPKSKGVSIEDLI
jgi:hypothetical protein